MKKIRSYSSIWSVEKVIYAINDMRLPFPMIDGALLKYFGIPVGVTWFMSQKTWDGKKPFSFIKSYTAYLLRPKQTFAGKPVKLKRVRTEPEITVVRSEGIHAVSD